MINKEVTTTFEFFQRGGAEETLAQAKDIFSQTYGVHVTDIKFDYACPGGIDGRWVGFKVTFQSS